MTDTLTVDAVIRLYVKLRNQKANIDAEVKDRLAAVKANMDKLEGWLLAKAQESGVTSFKTPHGTAYVSTVDFANVADWDAVLQFIRENEAFDMLERRVSKTAVRDYIDAKGKVPPGITFGSRVGINIRKPTETME